jgi:hypothetical protein
MLASDVFDPAAPESLPANHVSIADGLAAVTLSPFARDLTKAEKAAILAVDRQRIFICADAGAPFNLSDYPTKTLRWCSKHASLICMGALGRENTSEKDIEGLLSHFDTDEVAEHRFVIRLIVDARFDVSDYPWLQRPSMTAPVCGAAPHSARTSCA